MNKFFVAAAALALLSSGAYAKDIEIGGNVSQTVRVNDVTQRVVGNGNVADQNLATIRGSVGIGGNVSQTVRANDVTQWVIGNVNSASQTMGAVTSK